MHKVSTEELDFISMWKGLVDEWLMSLNPDYNPNTIDVSSRHDAHLKLQCYQTPTHDRETHRAIPYIYPGR